MMPGEISLDKFTDLSSKLIDELTFYSLVPISPIVTFEFPYLARLWYFFWRMNKYISIWLMSLQKCSLYVNWFNISVHCRCCGKQHLEKLLTACRWVCSFCQGFLETTSHKTTFYRWSTVSLLFSWPIFRSQLFVHNPLRIHIHHFQQDCLAPFPWPQ